MNTQISIKISIILLLTTAFSGCMMTTPKTDENPVATGLKQQNKYNKQATKTDKNVVENFNQYWYQGKAEVSHYKLTQNRYQDEHPGEVILIQVTEDFLIDKQVKNDTYSNPNTVPVLKTNLIRRFKTGLYDYQLMTSVFNPTNVKKYPNAQKLSFSAQDWCGQSFMQINQSEQSEQSDKKSGGQYKVEMRSYFEQEGDQSFEVPIVLLEDELFNKIRLNPDDLPVGEIEILPSTTFTRLMHKPFKPVKAKTKRVAYKNNEQSKPSKENGKIFEGFEGDNLMAYRVEIPEYKRAVEIVYNADFPFDIVGWTDNYPSMDGTTRTTIAERTHQILTDYWNKHSLEDIGLRKQLGLE